MFLNNGGSLRSGKRTGEGLGLEQVEGRLVLLEREANDDLVGSEVAVEESKMGEGRLNLSYTGLFESDELFSFPLEIPDSEGVLFIE